MAAVSTGLPDMSVMDTECDSKDTRGGLRIREKGDFEGVEA